MTGGNPARVRAVFRGLESLRAELVVVNWHEYPRSLEPGFTAMVVVEPIPASMASAVVDKVQVIAPR